MAMRRETMERIEAARQYYLAHPDRTTVSYDYYDISLTTVRRHPEIFSCERVYWTCEDDGEEYTESMLLVRFQPDFLRDGFPQ